MSCETRHRAIIDHLLTLADLRGTVDADTIIRIGSGRRSRRGDPRGPESPPPPLHDEVRTAMGITGHGADTLPAWVPVLIDLLVRGTNTNNRRARLTLQLITGGWDAVLPHLTDRDRAWLHTASAIGLAPPAAVATRLTTLPAAASIGWALFYPMRRAVGRTTVLDALFGIDAVPPPAVQAVTPRQVLQLAVGGPFDSRTDLHAVVRAVLERTSAAAQALRLVPGGIGGVLQLDTIASPSPAQSAALDEQGIALVLADAAATIRAANGLALDPTALRDPSAEVIAAIVHILAKQRDDTGRRTTALATLMHLWRTDGREDAVTATIRRLETILAQNPAFGVTPNAALLAAGVVDPPHGDAVVAQLCTACVQQPFDAVWSTLAGAAVYAAACQQHGYVPTVDGMADLMRIWWGTRTSWFVPSPIPLLAVGRERELLLPLIRAERNRSRRDTILLDCIDAMAMLALVGGDTEGFRTVLLDAIPSARDPLDPRVVIRLAADRDGQAVLAHLPSVPTPPAWTEDTRDHYHRLIPHLVSPAWMTAPQPLRTWWETTIRHVTTSSDVYLLAYLPPLYPTVAPQAAVVRPTKDIVTRAVAHPAWATLPTTERRACLEQALISASRYDILAIVARAATPAAVVDIRETRSYVNNVPPDTIHALQELIDTDLRRTP